MSDLSQAKDMIKRIYEDGCAEINGREYKFTKMQHKKRRKVFAFYSSITSQLKANDFSFLDYSSFEGVEAAINDAVTFDDSLLSRLGTEHWDEYPDDYLPFIGTALAVISFPFIRGRDTA